MSNDLRLKKKILRYLINEYSNICCYDSTDLEDFKKKFTQKIIQGCFYTGPNDINYFEKIEIQYNEDPNRLFEIEDNLYLLIAVNTILNNTTGNNLCDHYLSKIDKIFTLYQSSYFIKKSDTLIQFDGNTSTLLIKKKDFSETTKILILNKGGIYKQDLSEKDIDNIKVLKLFLKKNKINAKNKFIENKFIDYINNLDDKSNLDDKTINMINLKIAIMDTLFDKNSNLTQTFKTNLLEPLKDEKEKKNYFKFAKLYEEHNKEYNKD